jgi:hypothetical protein
MSTANPNAADDDLGGQAILEEALIAIEGVAAVLIAIGGGEAAGADAGYLVAASDYLGIRLSEHYAEAMDGYRRILRLDRYGDQDANKGRRRRKTASTGGSR